MQDKSIKHGNEREITMIMQKNEARQIHQNSEKGIKMYEIFKNKLKKTRRKMNKLRKKKRKNTWGNINVK